MTASREHPPILIGKALGQATDALERDDVDSPALSAQLLLAHVLDLPRLEVLLQRKRPLTDGQWLRFQELVARRSRGEPVAMILERKEFYGRDFRVTRDVLVPRPETEHVVEAALARCPAGSPLYFADLGCGSGALAVTLARELPLASGLVLDISRPALAVTRENARRHEVLDRLLLVEADFCNAPLRLEAFALIVANPPYVSAAEYRGLSREVRDFEPRQALVPLQGGGAHGLESLAGLLPTARRALRPKGTLLVEIGAGQGREALYLGNEHGPWRHAAVLPDLAGRDRVLCLERL
jgi:release factor glutamine methyltransferase